MFLSFDLHVSARRQQQPKCEPAIRFVCSLTCRFKTSLSIHPHRRKSNRIRSGDSNSSILLTIQNLTRVDIKFFLPALEWRHPRCVVQSGSKRSVYDSRNTTILGKNHENNYMFRPLIEWTIIRLKTRKITEKIVQCNM
jgi:hypothetical protein